MNRVFWLLAFLLFLSPVVVHANILYFQPTYGEDVTSSDLEFLPQNTGILNQAQLRLKNTQVGGQYTLKLGGISGSVLDCVSDMKTIGSDFQFYTFTFTGSQCFISATSTYGLDFNFGGTVESDAKFENINYLIISDGLIETDTATTRIISVFPPNRSTQATSSVFNFRITGYISDDDFTDDIFVRMRVYNNGFAALNSTLTGLLDENALQVPFDRSFFFYPTTTGFFSYSTTTSLTQNGLYFIDAGIIDPRFLRDRVIVSSSTSFIASSTTGFDRIQIGVIDDLQDLYASSTVNYLASCNIFSGFNMSACIYGLFVPPQQDLGIMMESIREDFLTRFPLGYATSIFDTFNNTSTSSLPIFTMTIPAGIMGNGSTITLDPNNKLDWILYDTSTFLGTTDTLYDITYYYWRIFCLICFTFYILRRIFGSFIPESMWHSESDEATFQEVGARGKRLPLYHTYKDTRVSRRSKITFR